MSVEIKNICDRSQKNINNITHKNIKPKPLLVPPHSSKATTKSGEVVAIVEKDDRPVNQ